MPSKKTQQKLMKRRIGLVARVLACASFLILTLIGISSLVRAMSLETIANENGIPASWKAASLGNPETITVPITYWDQRQESCTDDNRQFEWSQCQLYTTGALQGVVKSYLGSDGLPIPAYTNRTDAWNANHDIFTMNVTGHEPVQSSDNFYRWFHETSLSKRVDREITFTRKSKNTYSYGSRGIFPLDDVKFSQADEATSTGHNFHFTSHLRIPVKISLDGTEEFSFLGDDDVWVFLNNQLILDIGGLHQAVSGKFTINTNGSISTYVDSVADTTIRAGLGSVPSGSTMNNYSWRNTYLSKVHNVSAPAKSGIITNTGLKEGDVVNLDFFYAERSTSESNTEITISNMNWPISADSNLEATIVSKVGDTESNLVQNIASITNRDPDNPLQLERLAAYIKEDTKITDTAGHITTESNSGYLPLTARTLHYTTTPNDADSWQPVDITAPSGSTSGFNLVTPLVMAPAGNSGDTLYFRYFTETSEYSGTLNSQINFYTTLNGMAGVTYDYDKVNYTSNKVDASNDHIVTINYLYQDGSEAAPKFNQTYHKGDTYEVTSPEIKGHTADTHVINGVIADSDLEYTVYYIADIISEPETPETPKPEPIKYTVTVKYIYEDGTPAAESITKELEAGDEYTVNSPIISEYTPNQEQVSGTIDSQNIEHIVTYVRIPDPVVPSEPESPDEPIAPETPIQPNFPPSQIIDDDLLYLAPLGEVAYIPNTGIVGDAVAAIFEAGFAEIILSQGCVMALLLIFAASFATWFSLRKYINLDIAVRSTPSRKAYPKMPEATKKTRAKTTARNAHVTKTKAAARKTRK